MNNQNQTNFTALLDKAVSWGMDEGVDVVDAREAMLTLGKKYLSGEDVNKDEKEGIRWLTVSAYLDCIDAMSILENYYMSSNPELSKLWGDRVDSINYKSF